ncbi:hypothetical protein [Burkholderia dolosa]|jgi:hypothetical protein|uniref:hypothetical protein n=1 Tax=Burkholderia dolosa TaxID=152500 RepID=UPI001C93E339|nr:hypothetical protein [Burkholderia dolosa]MBY4829811.1 hypothetical protein [Burkholderia dolosa]
MNRLLYAGYLAFALYFLYPMVQRSLAFSAECVLSALPGTGRDMSTPAASDAHARDGCGRGTRAERATARVAQIH